MKHTFTLLVLGFLLSMPSMLYSQCIGCIPNQVLCQGTNGPCPNSFDTAYAYNAYEDTITFNLPATVDASQQSGGILGIVPFVEFKIANIQGLPFGVSWSCDQSNCTYAPYANNGTMACVRFCGLPLVPPGTYSVTFNCIGTIDGGSLGYQSGAQPFTVDMVVMPDTTSGNNAFIFQPTVGCAPASITFNTLNPSNGYVPNGLNSGFHYSWDFGNGIQSSLENPPPVIYYNSGSYPVHYILKIDTLPALLTNVTLTGANCSDFLNPADYYIKIFDGSNAEVFNNETSQSTSLPFSIPVNMSVTNPPYRIEVWDDDSAPLFGNPDDNCYDGSENPPPVIQLQLPPMNSLGQTTFFFTDPNTTLAFSYTYQKVLIEIDITDTIEIFDNPPATSLTVDPADMVCNRDSIRLSVYPNYSYEWYKNDTMVYMGPDHFYYAKTAGTYKVKILDPVTGCNTMSADTILGFYPNLPPGYPNVGIFVNGNNQLQSALSGNYTYQWLLFDGMNYTPIPGPSGTQSPFSPTINAMYCLIATNQYGCTDTSNIINYQSLGMEGVDPIAASVNIYPNPTTGVFTVELPDMELDNVNLKVTNMIGEMIYSELLTNTNGSVKKTISLENVPKGIYIVQLEQQSFSVSRRLVIR